MNFEAHAKEKTIASIRKTALRRPERFLRGIRLKQHVGPYRGASAIHEQRLSQDFGSPSR